MAAENIKAMLAHKYNPDKADYPAYIQPKLDGVRCLFTAKGAISRANNQFMNVDHIEQALKPFFAKNPTAILDGELYNHGLKDDFEKIISLVKKKKPTDKLSWRHADLAATVRRGKGCTVKLWRDRAAQSSARSGRSPAK